FCPRPTPHFSERAPRLTSTCRSGKAGRKKTAPSLTARHVQLKVEQEHETAMTANVALAEINLRDSTTAPTAEAPVLLRRGASWRFQLPLFGLILALAAGLTVMVGDFFGWFSHRLEVLIVLGGIGCWRWSWFAVQTVRAVLYRYWAFPRL